MARYPERLLVGAKDDQRIVLLQPDRLLLLFEAGAEPQQIEESLERLELRADPATEAFPQPSVPLEARVVTVPEKRREALDGLARELLEYQDLPAALAAAMPVYQPVGGGRTQAISPVPGRLLVRFRAGRERDARVIRGFGKRHELVHDAEASKMLGPFVQFVEVSEQLGRGPRGEPGAVLERLDRIGRDEEVAEAELDWLPHYALHLIPNDTHWGEQWNMTRIGMPAAWDEQVGGPGITIALIDSGIDLTHPDLAGAITPPATHFNGEEAAAGPGPYNANPDPGDPGGAHGSLTAGLAAALFNNGIGVAGVAGGCMIMPLRIFPGGYWSWLAAAINWARTNGAHVISMSLGGSTSSAVVSTALDDAWAAGVVLVAAAGNYYSWDTPSYPSDPSAASVPVLFPARHARCLAVGASDHADERKRFASADGEGWGSHYGNDLDVSAPGVNLWSTDIQGSAGWNVDGGPRNWQNVLYPVSGDAAGDYFALMGGTSGATPQVAGIAALLRLRYPALSNQDVVDIIERTCEKVSPGLYTYTHVADRPNGTWHPEVGHGRVNASLALHYADVMIADHSADFGAVPSTELVGGVWTPAPFWTWQPYITQDTNPAAVPPGEEAMAGQDNWLHAVVHNRGPAVANNVVVTWHVVDWAGTEFQYPADWGPANQVAATTIPSITPGADELVEVLWPQASVDIVAGFVHPCVLVEAACAQDLGGDLGPYVQQYNNIAQRNISFAPSGSFEAGLRQAVLPFAVGHRLAPARRVRLAADVSQLAPARAWLDLDPDPNHPSVRRITEADAARRRSGEPCFDIEADDESRFTVRFCGLRASVVLTSGSRISLPSGGVAGVDRANLRLTDASWVVREHKEVIGLTGAAPSVELSLGAGEVVPVAVVIEVPPGVDRPVAVHVGQIDGSVPTGGVTLVVEAAP